MTETPITDLDWSRVPSPSFVVDRRLLERNAQILGRVREEAGCKVLLALKGFAMWSCFDVFRPHLDGCCASGPVEARLGREEFAKEVHTYAPAFSAEDLAETIPLSDHIVFNSRAQLECHLPAVRASGRKIEVGIRCNPEYAEVEVELYNPCARGSRLGSTRAALWSPPLPRPVPDALMLQLQPLYQAWRAQQVGRHVGLGRIDVGEIDHLDAVLDEGRCRRLGG